MVGPILAIVGFFICIFASYFVCKTKAECDSAGWGMGVILGIFAFGVFVYLVRNFIKI